MPVRAMGQVKINVNGRAYRFDCGDGEEARLQELAAYVKARIERLAQEFGRVGDERLMLMAALLISDELMDARAAAAQKAPDEAEKPRANGNSPAKTAAALAAERREQDAIRSEHNRRIASGDA